MVKCFICQNNFNLEECSRSVEFHCGKKVEICETCYDDYTICCYCERDIEPYDEFNICKSCKKVAFCGTCQNNVLYETNLCLDCERRKYKAKIKELTKKLKSQS